ncbi:hypothetical protein [Amycolatopsis anabasis]|uniref:hypothetical protein n=1 Tax=Amycolatopsis anabasis TaxID=1840409 RepID=UPI00131B77A1|nr:hypothetical protein [Amycolatopsis anabasis]
MASWHDLVQYVKSTYRVLREEPDELRIEYSFRQYGDDDRTQVIVLAHEVLDKKHDWVQIASPCGLASQINLRSFLEEIGHTTIAGGAAIMGEHVVIRHSLPLENVDFNEFNDPLDLVACTADQLEEQFVGGDDY